MQRSSVWQLLMMYHRGFVERVFPQGMRRRRMYDLGLLSLQIISSEGWKVFLRRVKNKIHPPKNDLLRIRKKGEKCNDNDMTVDVIVPIYNAFEDTQKCIESLLSLTAGVAYRIIIINDKSTDPRITYYLEYLKQKRYSDIIIITNEGNIGFIKTVNKGIRLSKKNDVVILNSDTIVTYNWLKKLKECAYLDKKVATVTPLSNNATICSVPNFDQYNDVPRGYTIQEFALLIENVSNDLGIKCSKIPVGIGFCLYIKREVINEIGFYDEIFGRGYNEENDFCMRAYERGYYHVVDLSTYIYHKGKASFMSDQAILEEKNSKLLLQRYPYYMDLVRDFTGRNPLKIVQKSIKSRIMPERDAPIRIGLDAQLLARNRKTGSEVYISTLLENILKIDKNSLYVAFTSANTIDSLYYTNNKFMRKHVTDSRDILLDSESIDVFHRPIQCFSIYDLLILLKSKRSVITILDLILYHYPSYFNSPQEALHYKRLMRLSALVANRIIAISEHGKKDIVQNLGIPETKVDVIYLGVDTNKFKKIDNEYELKNFKKRYNIRRNFILYIGTDFPHKNHENLILAYKKLIERIDDVDLILAGPSTSTARRRNIEAAIHDITDRVIILDYVDDDDIVYLYNSAKLFVYPSLYEGFGLPLLEAMACGVPIVASEATSIPEVVGDAAVLVDSRNVEALCEGMHKVLTDEALRNRLVKEGLKRIKSFKWQETVKKTRDTYERAYKSSEKKQKKIDEKSAHELLNLMRRDENRLILEVTKEMLKIK
jgi:glycosyltransferase involved in cell wall biosynthesis